MKISHQVQIGFYHLCLSAILEGDGNGARVEFVEGGTGEVWIPPPGIGPHDTPVPDNSFSISLLRPMLKKLLFVDIPLILATDLEKVNWHYNVLCGGCEFSDRCREETIVQKTVSNIPHLSFGDHRFVKQIMAYHQGLGFGGGDSGVSDIEELHRMLHPTKENVASGLELLRRTMPSSGDKLASILMASSARAPYDENCTLTESPVLKAAANGTIGVLGQRCLTFPNHDDAAVYISFGIDPDSEQLFAFSIAVIETLNNSSTIVMEEDGVVADGDEVDFGTRFVSRLAVVVQHLVEMKNERVESGESVLRVQFYVFDSIDRDVLVSLLVSQACLHDASDESVPYKEARICIGALLDHSDVLLTTVQPELLQSTLLFTGGTSTWVKKDFERYLRIFEGSNANFKGETKAGLQARFQAAMEGMKARGMPAGVGTGGLGKKLPRIAIVHGAVQSLIAMPSPGYYQLDACHELLVQGVTDITHSQGGRVDASAENAYRFWKAGDAEAVRTALRGRRGAMKDVCDAVRRKVEDWCVGRGGV